MGILELISRNLIVKEELADLTIVKARKTICSMCPNNIKGKCSICKCPIEIKAESKVNLDIKKMEYRVTHCPIGNWEDKDIANLYRKKDGKPLL